MASFEDEIVDEGLKLVDGSSVPLTSNMHGSLCRAIVTQQ